MQTLKKKTENAAERKNKNTYIFMLDLKFEKKKKRNHRKYKKEKKETLKILKIHKKANINEGLNL